MARFTAGLREILIRIARNPEASQSDIAEELQRNRSTINAAYGRLVKLGYLLRSDIGDYRVTDAGKAVCAPKPSGATRIVRCPDCGRKITVG